MLDTSNKLSPLPWWSDHPQRCLRGSIPGLCGVHVQWVKSLHLYSQFSLLIMIQRIPARELAKLNVGPERHPDFARLVDQSDHEAFIVAKSKALTRLCKVNTDPTGIQEKTQSSEWWTMVPPQSSAERTTGLDLRKDGKSSERLPGRLHTRISSCGAPGGL